MIPSTPSELDHLRHILTRDLAHVASEVEATPEAHLWSVVPGVTNSVGTLAVHLCGNLRHFIGHQLGQDGYTRQRELEFSGNPMPKEDVLAEIQRAIRAVESTLSNLDPSTLDSPMPSPPPHHAGRSVGFFLLQLSCHLSRHTGQANYLRRILTAD
jgi:hypothetical protein